MQGANCTSNWCGDCGGDSWGETAAMAVETAAMATGGMKAAGAADAAVVTVAAAVVSVSAVLPTALPAAA